MGKKLTYEYVKEYFEKEGCELLENEYINNYTKMKYKCKNGHISKTKFNDFQQGYKCFDCCGSKKHTQEFVNEFISNEGWINKSKYKNSHTKLELVCPNGHIQYKKFNEFYSNKKRCNICIGRNKPTQEYVDSYFKNEGWINHSKYVNSITNLNVTCPEGHKQTKSFGSFKQGIRCRKCFFKNNMGENHSGYKEDRSRDDRSNYLAFDLRKIDILNNDLNYKNYIQSKKEAKLSDKNWDKTKYTVDHIYPRIAFIDNDLDILYDKKLIKEICNLRENLRIIHQKDNGSKGGKYNQEEFIKWFNIKMMKENNFVFL